jgi:hypothetical protein
VTSRSVRRLSKIASFYRYTAVGISNVTLTILAISIGLSRASAEMDSARSFSKAVEIGIFKLDSHTVATSCSTSLGNLSLQHNVCSKLATFVQASDQTMPARTGVGHFCSAFWQNSGFYKTRNSCPLQSESYGDANLARSKVMVMSKAEIAKFVGRRKSQIAELCCKSENCRKFIGALHLNYGLNVH